MKSKRVNVLCIAILSIIALILLDTNAKSQGSYNPDEAKFIGIIENSTEAWKNAPNDIQRESIPDNRNKALCTINKNPSNWTGSVSRIGTGAISGDILFDIVISNNIKLIAGSFLDEDGSKVIRGTKLFNEIANLSVGQDIIFSGSFVRGTDTCLYEMSLTNSGSIRSPEFKFIFKDVKLLSK